MIYHSIQDLLNLAKEYQIPLWEVVCRADMEERQVTKEQSFETMHRMYEAMKQADSAYDKDLKSASGLAGAFSTITAPIPAVRYIASTIFCSSARKYS